MSERHQNLVLPLRPDEVPRLIGEVVADLGWTLETGGHGSFEVREDPTKLHCHCSPLHAHLRPTLSGGGGTELRIEGAVPGWGPVASRHAREQTDLLARRLGLAALSASHRAGPGEPG